MNSRLPAAAAVLAAALGLSATATPALAATRTTPTELVVGLRSASQATTTVQKLDAHVDVLSSDTSPALRAVTVAVPAGEKADAVATLASNPDVTYVETNALATADVVTPTDSYYSRQWSLSTAKVPPAWNVTTGKSIVIAVVDTGVSNAGEIAGRVLPGYDFVNDDSDPSDDNGHGTMVSSVIAASANNGTGIAGICWQCQILPVKVLGSDGEGTYDDVADGITYAADHGAKVINLSLGGSDDSRLLADAIQYAYGAGAVVVASAGNDGATARSYPAAYSPAIAVAGSTQTDGRYSWSNYSSSADPWVDLAAPGSNYAQDTNGTYATFEGTSSAAPVVAGAAALALSADASATNAEVRDALESTADNVGSWVAQGRINTEAAVVKIANGDLGSSGLTIPSIDVSPASPAKGQFTVTPTVNSTAGTVRSVKMMVTLPNGKTTTITGSKAPWAMRYNGTGVNGAITIVISASDTAGNTTTASTVVTADNTAPSAALSLPSYVNGTYGVSLAGPSDDTAQMDFYMRNVKVGTVTSDPWTYDWDTSGLSGSVSIKVVVTDVAGNSAITTKNVSVDNAGPKLTWTAPTRPATSALRGTVEVKAGATDAAGVALVEVLDADGTVLGSDTTSPYVIPIDTTSLDGSTTLTLRGTDKLGQTSTLDRTLLFDNTAPVVGDVTASAQRGTITVTPDITDDTGIKTVKIGLTLPTGKTVSMAATAEPWSVRWVSTGVFGEVTATVTATDYAGNVATTSSTFPVDNVPPSAVWSLPTYVNGTVAVALTTPSDDTTTMEVLVKGKSVGEAGAAPWSIDWDTTGRNGAVPVTVRTTDAAGNTASVLKTITVDYSGPRLAVTSNTKITGAAAQIKVSVTDLAGTESVVLLDADGSSVATSTSGPYTLTVDTTGMTKGSVTWTLKATDKLGNVSTVTKAFTIA